MGWLRLSCLIPRALERGNAIFLSERFAMGSYCVWTLGQHRSSPKVNLGIDVHGKIINLIHGTIIYRRNFCFGYNASLLFLRVNVIVSYEIITN